MVSIWSWMSLALNQSFQRDIPQLVLFLVFSGTLESIACCNCVSVMAVPKRPFGGRQDLMQEGVAGLVASRHGRGCSFNTEEGVAGVGVTWLWEELGLEALGTSVSSEWAGKSNVSESRLFRMSSPSNSLKLNSSLSKAVSTFSGIPSIIHYSGCEGKLLLSSFLYCCDLPYSIVRLWPIRRQV